MTDTATETETMGTGELVYRATDPAAMRFREAGDGAEGATLQGRMMPYGEWTEVKSSLEGHFMERFAPGSLGKTMREQAAKVRVLFEHGMDVVLGRQAIAVADELRDEEDGAYFTATLLRGVPDLLVSGLRSNQYGSSIRFSPVKWDRVRSPRPSEFNPEGIPEHTVREAFLREFSVVTFPQYAGATAGVRSITDWVTTKQLIAYPDNFLETIRYLTEPQHSGREEPEPPEPEPAPDEPDVPERSRSTQPTRDYLKPQKGDPHWLL